MMEWLIRKHCEKESLGWPPAGCRPSCGRKSEEVGGLSKARRFGRQEIQRSVRSMNPQALASFLWSIAELLRGDYKQSDYGKVILPFTVLRRMDCVWSPPRPRCSRSLNA